MVAVLQQRNEQMELQLEAANRVERASDMREVTAINSAAAAAGEAATITSVASAAAAAAAAAAPAPDPTRQTKATANNCKITSYFS
jgi:hypothetical protein